MQAVEAEMKGLIVQLVQDFLIGHHLGSKVEVENGVVAVENGVVAVVVVAVVEAVVAEEKKRSLDRKRKMKRNNCMDQNQENVCRLPRTCSILSSQLLGKHEQLKPRRRSYIKEKLRKLNLAKTAKEQLPWDPDNLISITMSEANQKMVIELLAELQSNFADGGSAGSSSVHFLDVSEMKHVSVVDTTGTPSSVGDKRIEPSGWSCGTCKFINTEMSHLMCSMCGTLRSELSFQHSSLRCTHKQRQQYQWRESPVTLVDKTCILCLYPQTVPRDKYSCLCWWNPYRIANQVRVVVTGTDGSTPGTVTIPAIVARARVVTSYVVVTSSVCITTVIIILTLVDIVAPGTNQFVMWTVTRAALIVGSACCLSSELSMFAHASPCSAGNAIRMHKHHYLLAAMWQDHGLSCCLCHKIAVGHGIHITTQAGTRDTVQVVLDEAHSCRIMTVIVSTGRC